MCRTAARTTLGGRNGARTSPVRLGGETMWFLLCKHHSPGGPLKSLGVPPNPWGSHLALCEANGSYSHPGSFRLSTTGRYTSLSCFSSSGVRSTVSWKSFSEMMSWLSGSGAETCPEASPTDTALARGFECRRVLSPGAKAPALPSQGGKTHLRRAGSAPGRELRPSAGPSANGSL